MDYLLRYRIELRTFVLDTRKTVICIGSPAVSIASMWYHKVWMQSVLTALAHIRCR